MNDKMILRRDIIIPAGTVFENCDGDSREYVDGNFSHTIGLTKDSVGELVFGELVYGIDNLDEELMEKWFMTEEEADDLKSTIKFNPNIDNIKAAIEEICKSGIAGVKIGRALEEIRNRLDQNENRLSMNQDEIIKVRGELQEHIRAK